MSTRLRSVAASGLVMGALFAWWGAGFIAAMLFAGVAIQIFTGRSLTPLTRPLPFFAYPFLAATLFGWAWTTYRSDGDYRVPSSQVLS